MSIKSISQFVVAGAAMVLLLAGLSGCASEKEREGLMLGAAKPSAADSSVSKDAATKPQGTTEASGTPTNTGDEVQPTGTAPLTPPTTGTPPPPAPPAPPPAPQTPPAPPPPVVSGCTDDSACPSNQKCDISSHQCVTPWVPPFVDSVECNSDNDCTSKHGAGFVCSNDHTCVAGTPPQPTPPRSNSNLTLGDNWDIDIIGGPGGSGAESFGGVGPKHDSIRCPDGQVMVRVKVGAGGYLDAIKSITCSPINQLGNLTEVLPSTPLGGGGGNDGYTRADPGVISGFDVKVVRTPDQNGRMWIIGELQAYTKTVGNASVDDSSEHAVGKFGAGDPEISWTPLKCPQGSLAKGLYVRHGSFVDALGVSCQRVIPSGQVTANAGSLRLSDGYEFGPMTYDGHTGGVDGTVNSTGGAGGGYFEKHCSPNKAIVQFNMRAGVAIDQLHEIVCVDIADIVNGSTMSRETVTVDAGGDGGSPRSLGTATSNQAMVGWNHKSGSDDHLFDGSWILSEFQAHFLRIGPAGVMPADQGDTEKLGRGSNGFGNSVGWYTNVCPMNSVLTGVKGRAGDALDNLGGICQALHLGN